MGGVKLFPALFSPVLLLAVSPVRGAEIAELPHPRILFPKSAEAGLKNKLEEDPLAARLQQAALGEAMAVLKQRACIYQIPDGKRLLRESRRALHNIMHAGWAWRLGAGEPYRRRVIKELDAACGLKDWNPKHFLDTAEMATAVAVGYDWLYETLTPEQRAMCERALVEKALKPASEVYQKGGWWTNPGNNWSQVCGAGIAIAAAAVADVEPELSQDLYGRGVKLVDGCLAFYRPDGMYPEGPSYWHYGTDYHVMMLGTAEALGRPMKANPVFRRAGDSIMHLTGPTRNSFNFADSHMNMETPSPAQCWIASHFRDATQSAFVRGLFDRALREDKKLRGDRYFPLSILWLPADPGDVKLRTAAVFRSEQAVASFRTSWAPDAAWIAVKGGTPAASHGHMDSGSFVYETHGIRWIEDLGSDNYNLPAYFGGKRWDYYRLQNRSHNTLEIDGKLQNPKAKPCPLMSSDLGGKPSASFDLSPAYLKSAEKVTRTVALDPDSGEAIVRDEIDAASGPIVWRAFTRAKIETDGSTAVLRMAGKSIRLRCQDGGGKWRIGSANPPSAEENQNKGYRSIELEVPAAAKVAISVRITP